MKNIEDTVYAKRGRDISTDTDKLIFQDEKLGQR